MKKSLIITTIFVNIICIFIFNNSVFAKDSLLIGSDEWKPFHTIDKSTNSVKGFTVDLVKEILNRMNVKISEHKIYPWKRACYMVFNGALDAIFTSTRTREREQYCYFPDEPLTDFSYLFYIRKNDKEKIKYNTFDDLKGYRAGLVIGFSYTKEFMDFITKENNYSQFVTGYKNFDLLLKERVDYVPAARRVANIYIEQLGAEDKCIALQKPLMTDYLYIMFCKKTIKKEFVERFSLELKKFKKTQDYKILIDKYNWN